MRLNTMDADREPADPITRRIDEIGKTHIRAPTRLAHLLAQHREPRAAFIGEHNVIAIRNAGPKASNTARGQPFSAMIFSSIASASAFNARALSPTISSSRIAG